jgi:DNA-binding transcriptional LysR family regulator
MLPWDDVRYFLEVCRCETLAAAARRLQVDETTVGRRVAKLEAALEAKLIARTPSGMMLTPAGEQVRNSAEGMEREARALERRTKGADRRLSGRVRITVPEILGNHFLLPALREIQERNPEIGLELLTTNARLDVLRAEADVAVRVVRPDSPDLVCKQLGRYGIAPYVSARLKDRPQRPTPVVLFTDAAHPPIRPITDRLPSAPVAIRTNSSATVLQAVRLGFGAGDLPCFHAETYPDLVRLFPEEPPQLMGLWLVIQPDAHRTARVRAVVRSLAQFVAQSATLLEGVRPRASSPEPRGA